VRDSIKFVLIVAIVADIFSVVVSVDLSDVAVGLNIFFRASDLPDFF
jgi:hypothetical protein